MQLPDPTSHKTGWSHARIDGRWCVGMTGNLDTIHDAVLVVNNHTEDDDHARRIAAWVADAYNAARRRATCPTCANTKRVHVVAGCTQPARDIDCPTCVGTPMPGLPGIVMTSIVRS